MNYLGSASAGGRTNLTVDLTGLGLEQGDLIILIATVCSTVDTSLSTPSGFTALWDLYSNDTRDTNFFGFYQIAGETPPSSVTVSVGSSDYYGRVAIAYAFRGVDPDNPIDVTLTSATGQDAQQPDCPAITPVTEGALVLAIGGWTCDLTPQPLTAPSGYSNFVQKYGYGATGGAGAGAAICYKSWSGSGSENPDAFGGGEADTSQSWCAVTLAIRPQATAIKGSINSVAEYQVLGPSKNSSLASSSIYLILTELPITMVSVKIKDGDTSLYCMVPDGTTEINMRVY